MIETSTTAQRKALQDAFQPKTVDLSAKFFNDRDFDFFLDLLKNRSINTLILDKTKLTLAQTERVLSIINSNEKKGTKLVTPEGRAFGSIYTDWSSYNLAKTNACMLGLRETTIEALKHFSTPPKVIIDFGAGTGQDTIPLLKMGLHVIAIDGDEESLEILKSHLSSEDLEKLETYSGPFIQFQALQTADLFISCFTWPYRPKADFPECWKKTLALIKEEGIIAGHFFGPKDPPDPAMTYHTEEELKELLHEDFDILWFQKESKDSGRTVYGGDEPAWGELFHVVARKRSYSFSSEVS